MGELEVAPAIRSVRDSSRAKAVPSLLHSHIGTTTFVSLQILGALFPLAGGLLLFGWRAVGSMAIVLASTLVAVEIWRHIGWRGGQVKRLHCLWLAILLTLMLPPHLFSGGSVSGQVPWPLLPAAGFTLVTLIWLLGGLGAQRVHPSVVTLLVMFVLFHGLLTPRYVLRKDRLLAGDLLKIDPASRTIVEKDPWMVIRANGDFDSIEMEPPADRLLAYTSAQQRPDRASLTLQMLIRDQMPPLEDLIMAGQATAMGTGSGIAVIIGGLFLLYQGLIDVRIPLLAIAVAGITFLILPIPVLITDNSVQWRWFPIQAHFLGPSTAITFMNYEIFASPLLFTLFFLANAPGLRPMSVRGRTLFAITLGFLSAAMQLYASASIGPYVALLVASLLSPLLDHLIRPRTLV